MKIKITAIILIVFIALAGYIYYMYTKDNDTVVNVFEEGSIALVMGDKILKEPPLINGEEVLLPFDVVKEYLDQNIWLDKAAKTVTITTGDKLIRMKTDKLEAYINSKPFKLKLSVVEKNGITYIPVDFLDEYYNIEVNYNKDNNVVIVDFIDKLLWTAEIVNPMPKNTVIRKEPSRKSPIVEKISDKPDTNKVFKVFDENEMWYRVRNENGVVGYIEKRFVQAKQYTRDDINKEKNKENNKVEQWKPAAGKINLTWEMVVNKNPDTSKIQHIDGLDVVSPTWFALTDENGSLKNRGNINYVQWAHKNGYKVWALVSNDFNNPAATEKFFANPEARDNVIRQLLAFGAMYKLDGINIDFENINKQNKNALTQFVRELTPMLKEQGLVVSMDVTVPDGSDNWSLCYDRKAIGEVVDYVMLMAYDQYWSSSPVAGSVAQHKWVEANVDKVLQMVPKEKLILGLPFYTRLWKEEADKAGKLKLTSKAMSMDEAKKAMLDNKVEVKWDNDSGQFYGEYLKDNTKYKVWLEDENSINLKSSLVLKYDLAGAASWKRADETKEIWGVLNKNLKGITGYKDWVLQNGNRNYVFNMK